MAKIRPQATCHPDRPHRCYGLCSACYWKKYYQDHPWRDRDRFLRKTYGITLTQYQELLEKQKGCCAICGNEGKTRTLNVDHNHVTKEVRGLLCHLCNHALGQLRADRRPDVGKWVDKYLNGKS